MRGLLLTVLAACALAALALTASPAPPRWAESPGEIASRLPGWRTAVATLTVGLGVWLGGVGIEVALGRRAARVAMLLLALACPWMAKTASEAYWAPRKYVSVWRVTSASLNDAESVWRGVLGGECGYGHLVEVRLSPSGRGRGRAFPMNLSAVGHGVTAVAVLSPFAGQVVPVRAVLRDGQMTVWSSTGTLGTAQVVR